MLKYRSSDHFREECKPLEIKLQENTNCFNKKLSLGDLLNIKYLINKYKWLKK